MKRSPIKRRVNRTGPTDEQREAVLARAHFRCERCGTYLAFQAYSIHHRLPRGRGGLNELSNLVLLCGSATTPGGCHTKVESHREEAYDDGWLVRTGMYPREVPVNVVDRGPTLLRNTGEYAEVA